jgi:hypothetical protein
MCLITKDAIKDQTSTHGKEARANNGHNPMHSGKIAGPTKPKQRDRQGKTAYTGWGYLLLWCDVAVFVKMARLPSVFPVEVSWDGDAAG